MAADQPPEGLTDEQKERLANLRARREQALRDENEADYDAAERATLELFDRVLRDRQGRFASPATETTETAIPGGSMTSVGFGGGVRRPIQQPPTLTQVVKGLLQNQRGY
jgi:hypothetical protein